MLSLPLCVLAITRKPVLALAVMLVEGAGTIVFETVMVTVTQLETNETLFGRVAGLHEFVAGAAQLLGAAAAPLVVSGFESAGGDHGRRHRGGVHVWGCGVASEHAP
jgi:hypothetical protein